MGGARAHVRIGFLIPFFFITSGMKFDIEALISSPTGLLKLPLFVGLFLLVRGAPALLLYRGVLDGRDRLALAFYSSTELPLVVAITTVAIDTGHMRASTAAALVGGAVISTLVFPMVGMRLRGGRTAESADEEPDAAAGGPPGRPPRADAQARGRRCRSWQGRR